MGHWRKQKISFFVTSKCNLDCIYCYIPKLDKKIKPEDTVIDVDFAVAGMKDFFRWSNTPAIRYFSAGEATTAFDTMAEIQKEAYKLAGERLNVELQTNGFFSEKIGDWVEKNIDILWISCDGPPEINDKQRPTVKGGGSSKIVLKNIRRFSEQKNMEFGVRITFTEENFVKQTEILKYFKELGVKYVCGAPSYSSIVNPKVKVPPLLDFARNFVPAFFKALEMGMFYQTHLMVNFDEEVSCYCRACTTPICPELTSDGYVSCCDWASFGPEYLPGPLQQCIYGKYDRSKKRILYYEDKQRYIENRNVEYLGRGDCNGCKILKHCAGGCIGKVMSVSGDLHKMNSSWCEAVRYLAEHIPLNQGLYPVRHS